MFQTIPEKVPSRDDLIGPGVRPSLVRIKDPFPRLSDDWQSSDRLFLQPYEGSPFTTFRSCGTNNRPTEALSVNQLFGSITGAMKQCPHCGREVRLWRLWSAARWTPYQCAGCGGHSQVTLASRVLSALLGPLPVMVLGVGLLIYLDVQSWTVRALLIAPIAFAGSLLMGFLLARFGRFQALHDQSPRPS